MKIIYKVEIKVNTSDYQRANTLSGLFQRGRDVNRDPFLLRHAHPRVSMTRWFGLQCVYSHPHWFPCSDLSIPVAYVIKLLGWWFTTFTRHSRQTNYCMIRVGELKISPSFIRHRKMCVCVWNTNAWACDAGKRTVETWAPLARLATTSLSRTDDTVKNLFGSFGSVASWRDVQFALKH